MNTPQPMPTALKIVIGFFILSLGLDLYVAAVGEATTTQWVRIAIAIGIIVGLVRGSESVRAIVRAISVLGMLAGAIAVLRFTPYLGSAPFSLLVLGLGAGLLAVFGSLFTFWALGRENVEMWMARRSFAVT